MLNYISLAATKPMNSIELQLIENAIARMLTSTDYDQDILCILFEVSWMASEDRYGYL